MSRRRPSRVREGLRSIDFEAVHRRMAEPGYVPPPPPAYRDDPDPFGMDWQWADPEPYVPGEQAPPANEPRPVAEPAPERHSRPYHKTLLVGSAALAASLLVALGLFIGRGGERREFAAAVSVRDQGVRGPGTFSEVVVENRSGARAFVTLVGVTNGRHPVHFREDGGYIEAGAKEVRVLRNLPAGFDGASALLVVLTETPAGDVVRQLLTNAPPRAEDVRTLLKEELGRLGYQRAAVEVVPLP